MLYTSYKICVIFRPSGFLRLIFTSVVAGPKRVTWHYLLFRYICTIFKYEGKMSQGHKTLGMVNSGKDSARAF